MSYISDDSANAPKEWQDKELEKYKTEKSMKADGTLILEYTSRLNFNKEKFDTLDEIHITIQILKNELTLRKKSRVNGCHFERGKQCSKDTK